MHTAHQEPSAIAATGPVNRFVTVQQAARLRPAFTVAALRDIRFKSRDRLNSRGEKIKGNGSAGCWLTIGRKVLIDLVEFDRWLDSHRGQQ